MSPTSASRLHRIVTTPMSDLLVGRVTGRPIKLDRLLEWADLPKAADALVRDVVKRTRLWQNEKIAVAIELTAHFRDGLDRGRGIDELIETFGDPATAARLIRRAKIRNRSFLWHGLKWCVRSVLGVFAVYFVAWAWLMTGSPNPSVDYLAKMNEPALAVPEDGRAWPLYRELLIEHELTRFNSGEIGSRGWRVARPGDPAWPELVGWMKVHDGLLPAIREAAARPGLGLEVGFHDAFAESDWLANNGPQEPLPTLAPTPENAADRLVGESLIGVLLPHLNPLRNMASVVAADMRLAALGGDSERVLADFQTLNGLARHSRETPTLINQLVASSILQIAIRDLADILDQHPDALDDAQWIALAHELIAAKALLDPAYALAGERMWFYDTVQRIYSDDGEGGGTVTFAGLRFLMQINDDFVRLGSPESSALLLAGLPVAAAVMAPREELVAEYDRLMDLQVRDAQRPLWEVIERPSQVDAELNAHTKREKLRYLPIHILLPALQTVNLGFMQNQAAIDALAVAIALELYRRQHGQYPQDLMALVPRYLPVLPIDASTGEPLLYRLVDGKPLLYGRGMDGDDDGGLMSEDAIDRWPRMAPSTEPPRDGDWVLFPPPSPSQKNE